MARRRGETAIRMPDTERERETGCRQREMNDGGERKNELNKPNSVWHCCPYRLIFETNCRYVSNFLRFGTVDEGLFLCLVCQMYQIFGIWHI